MDAVSIIYIEDDETEALLFKLGMEPRGLRVLHVADSEATSLAQLETPEYQAAQAVFFDLWIGGQSGIELANQLRQKGDQRAYFLVTAAENPNPALLRELNITYVRKPADYSRLAAIVLGRPSR